MRRHRHQRTACIAGLGAAAATVLAVTGAQLPAVAAGGPVAAGAAAAAPVLLINGDRLTVAPAPRGGRAIGLRPAAGHDGVLSLQLSRLRAEIPADALPYLGRGLDLSLFSVAALQRAETGGRLPVDLTFAGRTPALPGVTITRSGPGYAAGYLTASSARRFGAALARQVRQDHARASYGADGLFAGRVRIALAGTTRAARHRPGFRMHTLTVTGRDLSGKADNGDIVWVFNADNPAAFGDGFENLNFFYHGVAKFSVPAGHYWAVGDFFTFSGTSSSERLAILPQFTVGPHTVVHVDERAASSEITTATPRPAVTQMVSFQLVRGGRAGSYSISWSDIGLSLWVSPITRRPTVGTLQSFTSAQLTSPPGPGTPYAYNLNFAGPPGIVPAQHFTATPASLATVNEHYYQDVATTGAWLSFGGFPVQLQGLLFGLYLPLQLPGRQVQYFSAAPGLAWNSAYAEFTPANYFPWGGQSEGTFRIPAPGQRQTTEWNRFPLHPQPDAIPPGAVSAIFPLQASANRSGDALNLYLTPFSDNQLGHLGAGLSAAPGVTVTGSYEIDQNGVAVAHGNPGSGIPAVQLSAKPSLISLKLSAARSGPLFPLSPASSTVWTWRSARGAGVTLPPDWFCGFTASGTLLRRCLVQPMMTLSYRVRGLALTGSVPPGPQVIGLSVGHLQLAAAAPVTGASAQVSYDDGQRWKPVSVTSSGGGNFRIAFAAPGGVDVTLRVSATDAAGGSVTETILRAYRVTF